MKYIKLRGVRQNNLKNIDIDIPLGSFTVICGPSGSGKSSLAFETLFAEGQRRYIESLSNYAKQFLAKAPKPDLDLIENIPPAIAIEQKNSVKNSRSSVGTTTEVIDYLRVFYEKAGVPHCPNGHGAIEKNSPTATANKLIAEWNERRAYLVFPIFANERLFTGKKLLTYLLQEGYLRILKPKTRVPKKKKSLADWGTIVDINPKTKLSDLPRKEFYVVVDRLQISAPSKDRLVDSVNQCFIGFVKTHKEYSRGKALIIDTDGNNLRLTEDFSCSECDYSFPNITTQFFSFNSPYGACQTCNGFGNILNVDEEKIVPNPERSIYEGAIHPLSMPSMRRYRSKLISFCKKKKISVDKPWSELDQKEKNYLWRGDKSFGGIDGFFEYLESKKYKMHVRVMLARYKSGFKCHDCSGSRLNPLTNHILIGEHNINDLTQMTIRKSLLAIQTMKLSKFQLDATKEIYSQLVKRLSFLDEIGVYYLTLNRLTKTLSGGEYQRLILAKQLGTGLSQTLYVLDEPTIGLHPRDNAKLIDQLKELNNLGNTLVVVEHDQDVILNASHIIEMGPLSGIKGGEVIFKGEKEDFLNSNESNTAPYLVQQKKTIDRVLRPVVKSAYKYFLEIKGCTGNNLQNVNMKIPLHRFVTITGVSGSGKSSLVTQTLYPALLKTVVQEHKKALPYKKITGSDVIKDVIYINQSSVAKNERSSPVTYLKIYDAIRDIFASSELSKQRGYQRGTFSLNVEGGRCPACKGLGYNIVDMVFMDDVHIPCESCGGKRFRKEILDVTYKGKHIVDVLGMTVLEAMDYFVSYPNIRRPLAFLKEVGLEYIQLGQKASSLSGGESQRVKIARELFKTKQKGCLYILDEPTTGLHFREVNLLIKVLNQLIELGGSVVVIEHNLEFISRSDYIIDMGPEAGAEGGKIVAQGEPEKIIKTKTHTGRYLNEYRNKRQTHFS